jgi:hypothetical protein
VVDIAMCNRRDCENKNTCFRYLAFPDEYQTYLIIELQSPNKDNCSYYWKCRNPKELRELNKLNEGGN